MNLSRSLTESDKQKLNKILEDLLSSNIVMKPRKYKYAKKKVLYLAIKLSSIKKLNLSKLEQIYIIQNLNNKGIEVVDESLESDLVEYDFNSNYHKYLSFLTEEELCEKVFVYQKTKDKDLKEQLVLYYAQIILHLSRSYADFYGLDFHELESYGYEGILEAINKFNPKLGYRFQAYAISYIDGYIKRGCRKILVGKIDNFSAIYIQIKRMLEEENDTTLTETPELIEKVLDLLIKRGIIKKSKRELVKRKIYLLNVSSLDDASSNFLLEDEGSELELEELISRIDIDNFIKNIDLIYGILTPKEVEVLQLRFGLKDGKYYTFEEIGKKLSVSKQSIAVLEKKILEKIRTSDIFKKLEYLYFCDDAIAQRDSKKYN